MIQANEFNVAFIHCVSGIVDIISFAVDVVMSVVFPQKLVIFSKLFRILISITPIICPRDCMIERESVIGLAVLFTAMRTHRDA